MIFISDGHHCSDPGAVANGTKEYTMNSRFKKLVCSKLTKYGYSYITDSECETLSQWLKRIKTGSGSVVVEYHMDAASPSATGATAFVANNHDKYDAAMAKELVDATASTLGIRNRGVKTEKESNRGTLAIPRVTGTSTLIELGFITNAGDLKALEDNMDALAEKHARILMKYEDLLK